MTHPQADSFRAPQGFEIKRRLGAGGSGAVYEARDPEGRSVALKHLRRADAQAVDRFRQEFELVKDNPHPRLVELRDIHFEQGEWSYSMQLIDGVHWDAWVGGTTDQQLPTTHDDAEQTRSTGDDATTTTARSHWDLDVSRLRDALRQLVEGVIALHERGIVHCDLKPSNVLISKEGRLFLVDFGIARIQDVSGLETSGSGARAPGTPAYMSPEQAQGSSLTLASDWYSVGVILFESLTGQLPFIGTPSDMLKARQYRKPRDPRVLREGLPDDLCDLCMALLERDPFDRPTGYQMGHRVGLSHSRAASPRALSGGTLMGRDDELRALSRAFELSLEGHTVVAHVRGGSGLGKTALVQRFVTQLAMKGEATVFQGRCFEHNATPFKAWDEVLESVARFINGLPELEAARLMPRDVQSLMRLFPQLARIALRDDLGGRPAPEDSQELRRRAFSALQELLARVTDIKPVVLVIDDAHWGDADSAECLEHLLALPEPPPLLLIAAYWPESLEEHAFLDALRVSDNRDDPRRQIHIALGALEREAAVRLALSLLPAESRTEERARRIAQESDSSPFLIAELVRAVGSISDERAELSLGDVVGRRVGGLPQQQRDILLALCAQERGLSERELGEVTSLSKEDLVRHSYALRQQRFVVSTLSRQARRLQISHLRLREAIWANVGRDTQRDMHARLGHLLESLGGEPEDVAFHYRAAGDTIGAFRFTVLAGDKAVKRSALSSAVSLYQRAAELSPAEEKRPVLRKLASAMGRVGWGPASAELHLALAAQAESSQEEEEERTRAGEQYLLAGLTQEAVETLSPVLRARGLRVPRSTIWSGLRLLYRRSRLLSRLHRRERFESLPSGDEQEARQARALSKVDLAWTLANGFAGIDVFLSAHYNSIAVWSALDAGESSRLARTLALDAIVLALEKPLEPSLPEALIAHAATYAERSGSNHARGWVLGARAILALSQTELVTCEALGREALTLLRESPQLSFREIGTLSVWFWLYPAFLLGRVEQLSRHAPAIAREAAARGDRYTVSTVRTYILPLVHLVHDDPELAAREADDGLAAWGGEDWLNQHWAHLHSHCFIDLYTGSGEDILCRFEDARPKMKAALQFRIHAIQVNALYLEGRGWLELTHSRQAQRAVLRIMARLLKAPDGLARVYAELLGVGLMLRNDPDRAPAALDALRCEFEALSMALYAAALRLRRAELVAKVEERDQARQALRDLGVADPDKTTDMLVPRAGRWTWGA